MGINRKKEKYGRFQGSKRGMDGGKGGRKEERTEGIKEEKK